MKIQLICEGCGCCFERNKGEINRNAKIGRRIFCSNSCHSRFANNSKGNIANLIADNRKDEYTEFKFYLKKIRERHKKHKFDATDIELKDLKELWENQNGTCPLTGWKMVLPYNSEGWTSKKEKVSFASLDRINAMKPYTKDNIRFICFIANMCKHEFTDEDVVAFCKAVSQNKQVNT